MKILLYSLIFAPDTCSNAYVFSDLARGLKKLGDDVTVITTTPHYDEASALKKRKLLISGNKRWYMKSSFEGINVFHIVVAPKKGNAKQRIITYCRFHHYAKRLIKAEHIAADVVLTQTPPLTVGITAHQLARKMKAKSVMILQDLFVDSMVIKGKVKGLVKIALEKIEKISYKKSDALSTISEDMESKLRIKAGAEKRIAVIPNFVDTAIYHPITESFRNKYGLSDDDFVISYVGNIGNAQDLMPLIELARTNKAVKILIAGNGTQEEKYRSIVSKEHLNTIRFLGYVSREETLQINSVSDICMIMLANHVIATSFPSKMYSLMAMGKPIVITCGKKSSAGTFIENNEIGFNISVDDTDAFITLINKLQSDRNILKTYGDNAIKLIYEQYSSDIVSLRYSELLKDVCKNN